MDQELADAAVLYAEQTLCVHCALTRWQHKFEYAVSMGYWPTNWRHAKTAGKAACSTGRSAYK